MKYSIIVAYYNECNEPTDLNRILKSLTKQGTKDFEVLMIHDGPGGITVDSQGLNVRWLNTPEHKGVWGHNCRDYGISKAIGDYIMFTNADNLYDPLFLSSLNKRIDESEIYVCHVRMFGMESNGKNRRYSNPRDYSKSTTLTGYPPTYGNIDVMQVVFKKGIIESWYSYIEQSDYLIYSELIKKHKTTWLPIIIGSHY